MQKQHPAPWWYKVAAFYFPERCREVPEAVNPDRIVLRQVALVKRYLYLQQFASSEDSRYLHSHQWHRTFALGLWGGYFEERIAGPGRVRRAPYFYSMGADVVHGVRAPSADHTSLFLGLWRDDALKHYYGVPGDPPSATEEIATVRALWSDHIQKMVKRI